MNRRVLVTSLIALVAVVAVALTAVLWPQNEAPLTNTPENGDVLLSVGGIVSTVDFDVPSDYELNLVASEGVTLADIGAKVLVTDTDGNKVNVSFVDNGGGKFTMLAPQGGYIPGAVYTVNLSAGVAFEDQAKAANSSWDFIISKPATEEIKYQDNVTTLVEGTFTKESDTLITSMSEFAVGSIIVIPYEGAYEAYKVDACTPNGSGFNLEVSVPGQEEVFKSIDISGKFSMSDGNLTFNQDLLEQQLLNSELVLGLGLPMPKITFPKVKFDNENKLVYLDILITFSDFIPDVESSLSILLSNEINIEPFLNYKSAPLSFNIGADMAIKTVTTFAFTVGDTYYADDMLPDELIDKLTQLSKSEISENFLRVFTWSYPFGPVFLSYDLDLVLRVSFAGTLQATTVNYSTYKLGVYYVNNDIKAICDKKSGSFDLDSVQLLGNLEVKAGVLNSLSLSLLQIAKVSLKLEAGLYADLYGAVEFNVNDFKGTRGGYYLDTGLYYDLMITAGIEILGFGTHKDIPLIGDKFSLLELGSRTMIVDFAEGAETGTINSVTVTSDEFVLPAMTVKQYDLVSRTYSYVPVSYDKCNYMFSSDNFSIADGLISLSENAAAGFNDEVTVFLKSDKNVTHKVAIIRENDKPFIVGDAIKSFDKNAPADLTFEIDLNGNTLVTVAADGLVGKYYTINNGVLTIEQDYFLRRPNGRLEITFDTDVSDVTVWVDITGTVSLYALGEGTEAKPWEIYTPDQLNELSKSGLDYQGYYFRLKENIDMLGAEFEPIKDFKGIFDGKGYSISNFVIKTADANGAAGLFAVNNGTIKDLNVDGTVSIKGIRTVNAGAIAGINYGTIDGGIVQGDVNVECKTNNLNQTYFNVGGVVGKNYGTINGVTAQNKVSVESSSYNPFTKSYIGGIAGFTEGDNDVITNCSASVSNINEGIPWYNGVSIDVIANS
ncbi:MAG: X2-like carbohydrate binding domain-containing protein [Christensenellales bacterium]|jgi:hypothetical protein